MKVITELADKHGVEITLNAQSDNIFSGPGRRVPIRSLVVFYRKHGFEGQHRAGSKSVWMTRQPR